MAAPVDLFRCDLPTDDPRAVCGGAVQHAEVAGPGEVALSYTMVSLSDDGAAPVAAAPERYWPRLAVVPWPSELP